MSLESGVSTDKTMSVIIDTNVDIHLVGSDRRYTISIGHIVVYPLQDHRPYSLESSLLGINLFISIQMMCF